MRSYFLLHNIIDKTLGQFKHILSDTIKKSFSKLFGYQQYQTLFKFGHTVLALSDSTNVFNSDTVSNKPVIKKHTFHKITRIYGICDF